MKLLLVTTVSTTIRAFLVPFAIHFRQAGWIVSAMAAGTSRCRECSAAFDQVFELDCSRNPVSPSNLITAPGKILEIIETHDYDLVHVHTPVAAFITRWALRHKRRSGRPRVLYTAHGFHFHTDGNPLKNAVFRTLEQIAGRWTDHLVVINREDEQAAHKYRIIPPARIAYMPGIGLDTGFYSPLRVANLEISRVRSDLTIPANVPLLLMIAEFNPGKRHRDVLRAFASLKNDRAHLLLAGDGPLRWQMQALAEGLGIARRVHFLGRRSDIPALIRAAVATVLPSEREGLPRSIMESLSLEVPAVGTDIRGIRDLLQDGCGVLVPLGNPATLAQAIDWMIEHPAEASEMGRRGRQKMVQQHDVHKIIQMHEELYARALGMSELPKPLLEVASAV